MRRQPEPIYATLFGTFQQAMEHTYWEELVKRKSTATRAKSPYGIVGAFECKGLYWLWLINVYNCRRSATCSLNLNPDANMARYTLANQETNLLLMLTDVTTRIRWSQAATPVGVKWVASISCATTKSASARNTAVAFYPQVSGVSFIFS